jgi:hypothetical protein
MSEESVKNALRVFTEDALGLIRDSGEGLKTFRNRILFIDIAADRRIIDLPTFAEAVSAIESLPTFVTQAEKGQGRRIVLRFIGLLASRLNEPIFDTGVFEAVSDYLRAELSTNEWTYIGVANLQNFRTSSNLLDLGDGITIRVLSFVDLPILLKWGDDEFKHFTDDFIQGELNSEHVLLVEQKVPKSHDNFMLGTTGLEWTKAQKMLMGLRLLKPGDVRIGRMFHSRSLSFNLGLDRTRPTGITGWHPGKVYKLEPAEIDDFRRIYRLIENFHKTYSEKWPNVEVALRSFSSMYDRYSHQAEDCILDAITALEALFAIGAELSFRLAFLTATILSSNDDERVNSFCEIRKYYKIRLFVLASG